MSVSLADLLARKKAAPVTSPDQEEVTSGPDVGAAESGLVSGTGASDEPYGVAQVVTPSGIEIYYQAGPKRLYRVKGPEDWRDWIEVPSMSDVKDCLKAEGLAWWGMKVGIEGVQRLLQDHPHVDWTYSPVDDVVTNLTANKLTVNHVRDKAGYRGTSVHKTLEAWAQEKTWPVPDVFPPEEKGYVEGLCSFLLDSGALADECEVMVGSLEWEYAGRFDLIAYIPDGAEVYVHRTEKGRGDRTEKIPGGRWLLDLKTSKDVYPQHHFQLAGYELAYNESYGKSTDYQGVIHVMADGRYKLVKSRATVDHFQNLKCLYDSLKEIG